MTLRRPAQPAKGSFRRACAGDARAVLRAAGVRRQLAAASSRAAVDVVDLWSSLPPVAQPKVEPAPAGRRADAARGQARTEPKVEPSRRPSPTRSRAVAKPDIALKEKQEKEEQEEAGQGKAREEETRAEDKQKRARRKSEEDAAEAQAGRSADAPPTSRPKRSARGAEQAATAQAKLIDEYMERIQAKIQALRRGAAEPAGQSRGRVRRGAAARRRMCWA